MVTLVLLRSVFASTVNAILIGFVLCTFSTLMLLLIKCKTTLCYKEFVGMNPGKGSDQGKQHKIKYLNMNSISGLHAFVESNDMIILTPIYFFFLAF